jgi:hypothetical protein
MTRALGLLLLLAAACRDAAEARAPREVADAADGIVYGSSDQGARHVRSITGFRDPESVLYDPAQDMYFVSNVAGFGSNKDDFGYIVRIPAANADALSIFVESGTNGVTLHAPKGMAIQGDTLWVTDIDVVRGFHRVTGQPVGTIDFSPHRPTQLNDIAAGPNELRVTDTGIWMVYEGNVHTGPDKIFAVGPGRSVQLVAGSLSMTLPNGIVWDSTGNRWIVVSFDRFAGEIAAMPATADSARVVLRDGRGQLDGVAVLPDGAIMFSSWADSSIHVLRNGRDVQVIREVPEPADIGLDTRRRRVLIPLTVAGQVQIWELPR